MRATGGTWCKATIKSTDAELSISKNPMVSGRCVRSNGEEGPWCQCLLGGYAMQPDSYWSASSVLLQPAAALSISGVCTPLEMCYRSRRSIRNITRCIVWISGFCFCDVLHCFCWSTEWNCYGWWYAKDEMFLWLLVSSVIYYIRLSRSIRNSFLKNY